MMFRSSAAGLLTVALVACIGLEHSSRIAVAEGAAVPATALQLAASPERIELSGAAARQRVVVHRIVAGATTQSVSSNVSWSTSNEAVAIVEGNTVVPKGNGTAELIGTSAEGRVVVPVVVAQFEQPHVWNFRNHVQSVLTKNSCNMGACHGAAAGKNGFRLSLRGYDPEADFFSLTRQARGRRVNAVDPGRSLLLTKPTGQIPHQGGVRFAADSLEYRVLAEWIAAGQPGPSAADARIQRLTVLPQAVRLQPGDAYDLVVLAHFSDGRTEDVTRWVKYTSTNFSVCQVDEQGHVTVSGRGEGAIVCWYLAQNVIATVTSPYCEAIDPREFDESPRANFIDDLVLAKLKSLGVPPSGPADDGQFLRRIYLDTIGVLPTADEARAFHADANPAKRQVLIDQLLSRPEYIDYWSYQWSDVFLLSGKQLRPQGLQSFYQWIRRQVEQNVGWDQIARQIVLAQGSTFDNGAANFYSLHQDPLDMAETLSMAFLGMSINCARCHDHPLEKWTNDDYYGLANMFSRVKGKGWGGDPRNGDGNRLIFVEPRGDLIQPRTGKPQPPRPLDGASLAMDDVQDRRVPLADWLTAKSNPYFSRALVNRVWANYFGVGLVEKVDDLRLTNPPSNQQLLDELSQRFADNGYDVRWLIRQIVTSQTYQRTHLPRPENEMDQRFYAHFYPRRLKAEVMLDAVSQVTGVPTEFKDQPAGTRALQLADGSVASYFLDTFGRPERLLTCTCERSDEPSMTQVLHLTNGPTLQGKLESTANVLTRVLAEQQPTGKIVEDLYFAALSRPPHDHERQEVMTILEAVPEAERRAALEDIYWSVLTSREFLFQH